jgi:hypothetical protein
VNFTSPDVYRKKALITRAARNKKGQALLAALAAYEAARNEARANGQPLPKLTSFLEGK